MHQLPFDIRTMEFLADHRFSPLTEFFLFASNMGEVRGYLLITTLIYVAFDKRLAVRLALLISLTMGFNHLLKIIIKNPRPFIVEGDYLQKWAVPLDNARDLATEWSTPSGHAMGAASFYIFLGGCLRRRAIYILAVVAILATGASRPYLGVHYVEDILLGWAIGLGVGLTALRYGERVAARWNRIPYGRQVAIALAGSLVFWLLTIAVNGGRIDGQPRAFLGYAGIATGVVIAWPLELRFVQFDPRSGSVLLKGLRYLLSVALSVAVLEGLGWAFNGMADDYSLGGYMLQYLRYILVGVVSLFVSPWIFTRLRLATTLRTAQD
ncbi:MAG: phosphatase PAP2 family protein [Sphingomonas sp.]|jgi:membrane-associated phospholipid phosphatase|uniref:phosphatase PAP2 family protein n=1 Tax=Sphingomonas sp. TaxID=28214 RepID=UPI003569EE4B